MLEANPPEYQFFPVAVTPPLLNDVFPSPPWPTFSFSQRRLPLHPDPLTGAELSLFSPRYFFPSFPGSFFFIAGRGSSYFFVAQSEILFLEPHGPPLLTVFFFSFCSAHFFRCLPPFSGFPDFFFFTQRSPRSSLVCEIFRRTPGYDSLFPCSRFTPLDFFFENRWVCFPTLPGVLFPPLGDSHDHLWRTL